MAYNKKKIYKQAIEAIKKHNLFFIEDIVAFIPCNKDTFYKLFPLKSDELDTIKGLLEENKVNTKSIIRLNLFKNNGSTAAQLALYRLICTDEERRALNQQYIESKNDNTNKNNVVIEVSSEEDKKEVEKFINADD